MRQYLIPAASAALVVGLTLLGTAAAAPQIKQGPPTHAYADLSVASKTAIKFLDPLCRKMQVTVTNVGTAPSVPANVRVVITKGSPAGPVVYMAPLQTVPVLAPGLSWHGYFATSDGHAVLHQHYFVNVIVDPAPNHEMPNHAGNNRAVLAIP